jgi:hypothetical protein
MKQYDPGPTPENRLLDALACSDEQLIHDVIIDDVFNVSDHRLVKAQLKVDSKRWTPATYKIVSSVKTDGLQRV